MASLLRRGLRTLLKTPHRVTGKATRSVSYVAESLSEDYGERRSIDKSYLAYVGGPCNNDCTV